MIPALIAIVVVFAGLSISTTYMMVERKKKRNEEMDFRCPECGASVDGNVSVCPECLAEFQDGEFGCPVCGSAVSADTKVCMVCNERFEEDETFECPHCGSPIQPDTIVCAKCDEEFWSPIKPADVAEVEAIAEPEHTEEAATEAASP
jgi:DNA-directed RNA polymerase subunit RPC12/RpoP